MPYLSAEQLAEALAAARAIADERARIVAFVALAPRLSLEQRETAIAGVLATAEAMYRGDVLGFTEDLVAAELLDSAPMVAAIIDAQPTWP